MLYPLGAPLCGLGHALSDIHSVTLEPKCVGLVAKALVGKGMASLSSTLGLQVYLVSRASTNSAVFVTVAHLT